MVKMKPIALACDQGGFELMSVVRTYLDSKGYSYKDFGTFTKESCDYPEVVLPATKAVVSGECGKGILICGTGIGVSMVANKVSGIRAAVCTNEFMAEKACAHNNANVLALGGRVLGEELAVCIVDKFLNTEFSEDDRHRRRVDMINCLDKG